MSESSLNIQKIIEDTKRSANMRNVSGKRPLKTKITTSGPEKNAVDNLPVLDSEVSKEEKQLVAIYNSVIVNGDRNFFVDQNNVISFLDDIVVAIYNKARDKKIDQISLEEKTSIVDKLRKTEEILNVALEVNLRIDDTLVVSPINWIKLSIKGIKQQLEKYS
jgi:hypothetical protein